MISCVTATRTDKQTRRNAADRSAFAAAREVCRRRAADFYFASFFLPKSKRDAAHAVGAFCCMISNALDLPASADPGCGDDSPDRRLDLLRDRLTDIYDGRLRLPDPESRSKDEHVLRALAMTAHRYQIPQQYFLDFASGCRAAASIVRYPTWSKLHQECDRVGGSVSLIVSSVLGLTHSDAGRQIVTIGSAIHFTRLLTRIKANAARGRIDLPLEDLARFKYSERDLVAGVSNDNFRRLIRFEVARARKLLRSGADGLCWLAGDGSRLAAATVVVGYAGVLDAIERNEYDLLRRRTPAQLTTPQKLMRLPRAVRLARRLADEPMPASII
jgi:phytoene synthase